MSPDAFPQLPQAVTLLKQGQLVAFPTETVYGLGADARNPEALERLYATKGRPRNHPVIVHLARVEQLSEWAQEIPETAWVLAKAFWPGPLTLLLKRHPTVSDQVTGGQETIALRIPAHPVALALLEAFEGGLAAPSANRFGRISPTTPAHVYEDLGEAVPLILDGGPCEVGIESTIVDLTQPQAIIRRPGLLTAADMEEVLGQPVQTAQPGPAVVETVRTPGALESHYAPQAPLRLLMSADLSMEVTARLTAGQSVAVLSHHHSPQTEILQATSGLITVQLQPQAAAYAKDLYAALRWLDAQHPDVILVEDPPRDCEWVGIRDRLSRAAAPLPPKTGRMP